jgi:hypothetical protein
VNDDKPTVTLATLTELVEAVAGRLRSLGEARLGRPPMRVGLGVAEPARADGPSVADRAYDLALYFVAVAARLGDTSPPPLPRLPDLSAGDQLAVVGHELVGVVGASQKRLAEAEIAGLGADEHELCDRLLADSVRALKDFRAEL